MIIGVPKEIKIGEFRVALTPAGAEVLCASGHQVLVQKGAGEHAGFPDVEYRKAGAALVDAKKAWSAELVVKVKEPLPSEFKYFRPQKILFPFLHLAPNPVLVKALLKAKVTAIAYETVEDDKGRLPILEPMSEIQAVQKLDSKESHSSQCVKSATGT